jgi:hypothetical protein
MEAHHRFGDETAQEAVDGLRKLARQKGLQRTPDQAA